MYNILRYSAAVFLCGLALLLSGCGAGGPSATPASQPAVTLEPIAQSSPAVFATTAPAAPTAAPTSTPRPSPAPTTAPTSIPRPSPVPTVAVADWLSRLNGYRAAAKLPPVTENAAWSASLRRHAEYMVKTGSIEHVESLRSSPYFSTDGSAAGEKSNVAGWSSTGYTDSAFVDLWMAGPFHAVAILDPALTQTAFGSYRDAGAPGSLKAAAALDVLSGHDSTLGGPLGVHYPVMWPADGQTISLTTGGAGEYPDPLTGCPSGYADPTGMPLYVLLGPGPSVTPQVQAVTLKQETLSLEVCTFDGTNFHGADSDATQLGREVLRVRSAVVLIPKRPLTPGARYSVSVVNSGQTFSWSFVVSSSAAPP